MDPEGLLTRRWLNRAVWGTSGVPGTFFPVGSRIYAAPAVLLSCLVSASHVTCSIGYADVPEATRLPYNKIRCHSLNIL